MTFNTEPLAHATTDLLALRRDIQLVHDQLAVAAITTPTPPGTPHEEQRQVVGGLLRLVQNAIESLGNIRAAVQQYEHVTTRIADYEQTEE